MARGEKEYQGKFTWVDMKDSKGNIVKDGKGNAVKTRKFGKPAEEAPKAAPAKSAAPKKAAAPAKKAEAPVTKDAMKGYRKGDVTTSKLFTASATGTAGVSAASKKKPAKMPERPISPTRDKEATGRYSKYEGARVGNYTQSQYDALTPAQKEAKGLPVSWMDWVRVGGKQAMKPAAKAPAMQSAGRVRKPNVSGMAKGGMASKKGC